MSNGTEPHYLPDPSTTELRARVQRAMTLAEWEPAVMDSVMFFDNPTPAKADQMMQRLGMERTREIILEFMEVGILEIVG